SGGGAGGGSHVAALASELGFAAKPGCGAFLLPETANGRGVAEAWAAADDEEGPEPEPLGLLIVSGDEAAANPNVRALAESAERAFGGVTYEGLGEQAQLPERMPSTAAPQESQDEPTPPKAPGGGLQLLRYRPLFSGAAVERVPELQFQRPAPEIELSPEDAQRLGVKRGEPVDVRSNGTSIELRATINKRLKAGVARIAEDHARDLHPTVEVSK